MRRRLQKYPAAEGEDGAEDRQAGREDVADEGGAFTLALSAMDLTMKFGPLRMEVIAPKKTEPRLTAITSLA